MKAQHARARRAPWRFWVLLLAFVATVLPVREARAQHIDVTAAVDSDEIELGDTVTLTLQATTTGSESPSDPQLGAHSGFTVAESGAAPTHMVSIINGRKTEKHGLTASWSLRADRLGTFSIGPPSVAVGAARKSGSAQRVTVVAPGRATGKRGKKAPKNIDPFSGSPFDPFGGGAPNAQPFDPFKGLLPGLDDDRNEQAAPGVNIDPKLALDAPRGPIAFLHATVDKTRAVVGEQVTLHVYLYEDPHARQGQPSDIHEATATDFVKRSLLQDETKAIGIGGAMVGGRPWAVKLVRKNALFPLKTGRLTIAPMSLTLSQARVGLRESENLAVEVQEPPLAGRPPGYQVGDVGDFSLSANVTPRRIDQHGGIGVTVELRGTGNIPAQLPTPVLPGIEWLEPQTRDALGAQQNDRFGGTRTFAYVVRLHQAGAIDLGEVKLPYFDAASQKYGVAHAALGIIDVARNAGRDAGPEEAEPVLAGLPKAREALEGGRTEMYVTERPIYWGALFGSPLACALAVSVGAAARRLRARRANAAPNPDKIARDRRDEAESALRGRDGKVAAAAVARAVEATVIAKTGVNIRGTSRDAALGELASAGADDDAAKNVLDVLRACEDARFSPDGVAIEDARALWARAKDAIDAVSSTDDRAAADDRGGTTA
jgi:oxygen tolerance protein BatD